MSIVEALEDGRIVLVSEEYARREGLLIIRNNSETHFNKQEQVKVEKEIVPIKRGIKPFDEYRKPLKKNNVISELQDNFHWALLSKRKQKGWTRKQLAQTLYVSEEDLKLVENGVLPKDDLVLVSKLESFYKISLRKDGQNFFKSVSMSEEVDKIAEEKVEREFSGNEIEIDD